VRREVVEALFRRADRLPALMAAMETRLVTAGDLDPARRRALAEHPDAAIRDRAAKLLGPAQPSDRKQVIDAYLPALDLTVDVARGAKLFEKHCATCHRVGEVGTAVGPDLATVQNRTPQALLEQILDPNREIQPNYLNYSLVTGEGRVITGVVAEETAASVRLRRAEGAEDTVLRSNIDELVSTGVSLMPEGLEKDIDRQQLADLIAFVLSIHTSPTAQIGSGR
jgi:putative heme-binding domain-containing protein